MNLHPGSLRKAPDPAHAVPYWNGEQPRPRFQESDTYLAHELGLCRADDGQCDSPGIHSVIEQGRAQRKWQDTDPQVSGR